MTNLKETKEKFNNLIGVTDGYVLLSFTHHHSPVNISIKDLSLHCGYDTQKIRNALSKLTSKGYVSKSTRFDPERVKTFEYTLLEKGHSFLIKEGFSSKCKSCNKVVYDIDYCFPCDQKYVYENPREVIESTDEENKDFAYMEEFFFSGKHDGAAESKLSIKTSTLYVSDDKNNKQLFIKCPSCEININFLKGDHGPTSVGPWNRLNKFITDALAGKQNTEKSDLSIFCKCCHNKTLVTNSKRV